MNSIGHAYAVMKGNMTGNRQHANKFLRSLSKEERMARNRSETRRRGETKEKAAKFGARAKKVQGRMHERVGILKQKMREMKSKRQGRFKTHMGNNYGSD